MKRILALTFAAAVLLNLSACNLFKPAAESSAPQSSSSEVSSVPPVSSAAPVSIPEIKVEDGKVKVTLPAFLFNGNEDFQLNGIDAEDITKNPDGSYTVMLDKEKYAEQLKEYKSNIQSTFEELTKNFASVQSIKANDDFTALTVVADKETFQNSLDSFAILGVAIGALTYQAFTGVAEEDMDVLIEVKDAETGEVFLSKHYPEGFSNAQ